MPVVDKDGKTTGWMVFCPACESGHHFNVTPGKGPVWTFVNGDVERPTFLASYLVASGHYAKGHKKGDACWCTYRDEHGKKAPFECRVCHSFVENGKIRFLNDCTHKLAGRTVDLPDWDEMNKKEAE
jgi:hypothetical protein